MQHTQKQTLATKSRNQTGRQPASHLVFLTPSMPWTCLSPWVRRRPCAGNTATFLLQVPRRLLFITPPRPRPSPPSSHLGLSGSRGAPSFRQLTRGGGAPSTRQGSTAVWFTEAFTAGGPGWMVGTTGGGAGHRASGCWEPVALGRASARRGEAHSLWISTRKATLVLPAALRAVQL